MSYQPTYRLRLYRDFKALDAADFHSMVRYYEQHEHDLRTLDFEEYLDCTLAYLEALFQTGEYERLLPLCDELLELTIMHNVGMWGGKDLYTQLLFRKATAHYNIHEFARAEHVLQELLKINPHHALARRFLYKVLLHQKPAWLLACRAAFVGLTLLSATVIALEFFVLRNFFPGLYGTAQIIHVSLLGLAIGVLFWGEARHSWRCRKTLQCLLSNAKGKRKARP